MINLQKPLNPEAEEYQPQTPPPPPPMPLLLSAPPQPQLAVALPHTISPPQPYFYLPHPHYTIPTHYTHSIYTIVTVHLYLPKAAAAAAPPLCTETTKAASPPSDPTKQTVKSPKCPSTKAPRRRLPPRILKAVRARAPAPPPPPKQEWWPKIPANTIAGGAKDSSPPMTTLMIKNIPNQLRRDFMLKFLDGYCKYHSVSYDFFYLPIDFENRDNGNLGYAFVNFTTNAAAIKMKEVLNNYKWRGRYAESGEFLHSRKICEMRWARGQGKEALIRRFQMSRFKCSDEEFLPVVLDPPRNGSDPNPPPPLILGKLCPRAH